MTKDEIIELAKQAWISDKEAQLITEFDEAYISCTYFQDLERFASIVAQQEREKCALLCYEQRKHWDALACADAIRAGTKPRGQA